MVDRSVQLVSLTGLLVLITTVRGVGQTPSACPAPSVDTTGWREVAANIAPFTFRLPADVPEYHYRFQAGFATPGTPTPPAPKRQFFSSLDTRGLHIEIGIAPRPRPGSRRSVFAADSTVCSAVIDGHSATLIIYRSKPQPSVRYNILASVDLAADSVLEFRSSGDTPMRQAQALAALRTVHFHGP